MPTPNTRGRVETQQHVTPMMPDTAEDPFTCRPEPAQMIRSIDEDLNDDDDDEMGVETEDAIQFVHNLKWSSMRSLEGTQALERAIDEALGCANRLKNDQRDMDSCAQFWDHGFKEARNVSLICGIVVMWECNAYSRSQP
ncbi:hypothetical protein IW261DRAFT_1574038 [Armillaria novae-zelandiae]|uniref:Uncharacterized protein n=1 Tax=Armillaria novae-zelandiae TaxID=153914 RepID=A0AA39U5P6_9AGAR|nr:hypothetical protein IW261DRAFT_1574038 [Armillaria novae-zelandiae]